MSADSTAPRQVLEGDGRRAAEALRQLLRAAEGAVGDDDAARARRFQVGDGQLRRFARPHHQHGAAVQRAENRPRELHRHRADGEGAATDLRLRARPLAHRDGLLKKGVQHGAGEAVAARRRVSLPHLPEDFAPRRSPASRFPPPRGTGAPPPCAPRAGRDAAHTPPAPARSTRRTRRSPPRHHRGARYRRKPPCGCRWKRIRHSCIPRSRIQAAQRGSQLRLREATLFPQVD